jgi:hypothetical protein
LIEAIGKHEIETSMDIILPLLVTLNLDDDDMEIFYDEVHNELKTLFASSMNLIDDSSSNIVELGENPSMALDFIPLASWSPYACYTKQDSEANDLILS